MWEKCPSCNEITYRPELEKKLSVCHHCNHHFRVSPELYVELLLDKGTSTRHFQDIVPHDFLGFNANKAYKDQIIEAINKTGESDAINVYDGNINNHQVVLGVMNFKFIGGSMGSVVGEVVSRALIMAGEKNVPFIFCLLYTSPSPRDRTRSRMPSSA